VNWDTFWAVYGSLILTLGINALLAISIWLTLACGMLAMANAAFMGIGAYASAILTTSYGLSFPIGIIAGLVAPSMIAFAMGKPTLRLSGVYLAMATLAFGEIVRIVAINAEGLTGGALGLNGIPPHTQWGHVAVSLLAVLTAVSLMRNSKLGRAFEAIKEDETAASQMGIDVKGHKLFAFVLGAAIAGLAGTLSAHMTFFIGPNEFGFDRGVEILTMAILGGVEGLMGPVIGAVALTLLPEVLRGLQEYRLIVNGLILVLVVLYLPGGIWRPRALRVSLGRKVGAS
jgi:branched-chain amino acid transport system permease protein